MAKFIALLRGINVSGQKKILMVDLRKLLEKHNFQAVKTYIQSGNIIFESNEKNLQNLALNIQNIIFDAYGFKVPTIVLKPEKLKKAIEENPYKGKEDKLYLTILNQIPLVENQNILATYSFENESYILINDLLYFYAGNGAGRAKMSNNFFEKKLKVQATTRNWKTVKKLSSY